MRRYLSGKNPLGQHIEEAQPDDPEQSRGPGWQVIGVVGDAKYSDLREEMGPTFYTPSTSNSFFSIRTAGDPLRLASAIRDAVNRRDSSLAIYDMRSEAETIANSLFRERYLARFSSFFALLALLLACTGIYGLLSFEVARRTREIGVRMALGAQRVDAIRLVLGQGLRLALIGTLTGLAASLAVARLLADLLYRVHSFDALTLSGVSLLLLAVALAACYLPARQATRVDPLVALRYE